MSDPKRLLEDGSGASDTLRELLRAAKKTDDPTPKQLDALSSHLTPLLAPQAGIVSAAVKVPLLGKAIVGLAIVGAVAGVAYYSVSHRSHVETATTSSPPSAAIVMPAPTESAPATEPEPTTPTTTTARAAKPIAPEMDLEAERKLANDAQAALASGDATRALSLTSEHRRRFPQGPHAEERDRIAIEALVRLGRTTEARAAADRFFAKYPRSVYRARVESLLP